MYHSYNEIRDKVESIFGFMMEGQEEALFNIVKSIPSKSTIVEIGSLAGRSTTAMGFASLGRGNHIYAIDVFISKLPHFRKVLPEDYYQVFLDNIRKNNIESLVEPIRGRSEEIGKSWDKEIDMLFIDGGHIYDQIKADFDLFYRHVRHGGIVALHDVGEQWTGIWKLWNEKKHLLSDIKKVHSLVWGNKI